MAEKIVFELSREHARIVQDACEMLMRLRLGQSSYAVELMLGWPTHEDMDMKEYCMRRDTANKVLEAFLHIVLGTNGYGYPDGRKDEIENLAYEVWGMIRHVLYLHDYPNDKSYDVRAHEPLKESKYPMPKCRVVDVGEDGLPN